MFFCNFRKILMIFVVLGLQFVPQVFNIFEKRILRAHRTFGRSTENHFFGLTTTIRMKNVSKVSKTLENHTTFSNIFWSEAAISGANSKINFLKLASHNFNY